MKSVPILLLTILALASAQGIIDSNLRDAIAFGSSTEAILQLPQVLNDILSDAISIDSIPPR